jgi:hypothetical protein
MTDSTQGAQDTTAAAEVVQSESVVEATEAVSAPEAEAAQADQSANDYSDLSVGEGYELDAEVFDQFKGLLSEINVPKEAAQKLLDLQTAIETKRAEAYQAALVEQSQQWEQQVKADKELGGDNFEKTQAVAIKAIESFGSPELRQLLNDSGLGNHPELVKFCHRVGLKFSEDSVVLPGTQAGATKSIAERLWN